MESTPAAGGKLRAAIDPYLRLPRSIYVLFIATVVNGMGIFVFPFMTLILTRNLGFDAREAGLVLMAVALAYIPGGMIGGKLSDRFGRKKVMLATQLVSVGAFIPCGFLGGSPLVALFIVVSVFFDGITDPARNAMNVDLTTPENRQVAFSLIYLGHNLGFALGPLIAGFLFTAAPRWIFRGNALAAGLASLLVLVLVPETRPSQAQLEESLRGNSTEKAVRGGLWKALGSRPFLVIFVCITSWYGFAYAQHRFLLPLQAGELFGEGGYPLYGLLMTFNAILVVLLNIPVVTLLKRLGPVVNTAVSGFLYALGFGMLAFVRSPFMFFVSTFAWTLGEIVNATSADVYVANHTPMSHRGRFNAVIPIIWGVGWTVATPVSGAVSEAAGIPAAWLVVAAVAALSAAGVLILDRAERTYRKRTGMDPTDGCGEPATGAEA